MSRTPRFVLGGAALVLVISAVWVGLTPKAIHLADCGSPYFPADTADMTHEVAYECGFALDKRYALLWWLFIGAGALGLAAACGGVFTKATPQAPTAGNRA